jgi:hypothetical protein
MRKEFEVRSAECEVICFGFGVWVLESKNLNSGYLFWFCIFADEIVNSAFCIGNLKRKLSCAKASEGEAHTHAIRAYSSVG